MLSCLYMGVYVIGGRGGGTKKKVGGLTLPLNDCTEAGVQGRVALTVGVVLGPVLNLSKSFQINCVKR